MCMFTFCVIFAGLMFVFYLFCSRALSIIPVTSMIFTFHIICTQLRYYFYYCIRLYVYIVDYDGTYSSYSYYRTSDTTSIIVYVCMFTLQIMMGPTGPIRTTEPTYTTSIIVYVCMFTLQIMMGPTVPIRTTEPTDTTSIIVYVCMITMQIMMGPSGLFVLQNLYYFVRLYVYIVDCEGTFRSYSYYITFIIIYVCMFTLQIMMEPTGPIRTTEPIYTTSIIVYVCMFTLQIVRGTTVPIHTTEPTDTTSIIVYVCMFTLQIVRGTTVPIRTTEHADTTSIIVYVCMFTLQIMMGTTVLFILQNLQIQLLLVYTFV